MKFTKIILSIYLVITMNYNPVLAEEKTVLFSSGDPKMNAAIAKSRGSLDVFWNRFAAPANNEGGFALKIAISQGNITEHFWCGELVGDAEYSSCTIQNEAQDVTSVKLGQAINVDPDLISDWMYLRDGKIVGGQTIRVIAEILPKEEADFYRQMLAPE